MIDETGLSTCIKSHKVEILKYHFIACSVVPEYHIYLLRLFTLEQRNSFRNRRNTFLLVKHFFLIMTLYPKTLRHTYVERGRRLNFCNMSGTTL